MAIAPERGKRIFRKTEKELLRLASEQRAESVHSFRTTTRRLQTLLQELVPGHGRNQKKLLKALNRIRKSAGEVRDIDVQLEALRKLKSTQEPRRKTQLTQKLLELRAQREKKLRKLLTDEDIREVRKRLRRASGTVDYSASQDALAVGKKMLGSVVLPAGPASEELLHRYRIVVKRARYAAEFAPSSPEVTQFLAQLKQLQDALGHWHDWLTLTHTAVERLGDVNQSPLVAALTNVTRGKFRNAVAAVSFARSGQTSLPREPAILERSRKLDAKKPARMGGSGAAA
ncbi:MAG TPA: CHAD domain-containing protein [Candidatus Dormibacteraeota bacterium]|nr:CHAD domain-containing protein [Candidatus Dormibacteraeota bacterium]